VTGPAPSARERFERIARGPDPPDLAEAALLIAAEEYPDLAVGDYLARLDELAAGARLALAGAPTPEERVLRLNRFLFDEQGFRGNRDDYYDPRNSFLNVVLDRRTGIPITLSLVFLEVARRVEVAAHGVGFPGHFLVAVEGDPVIVVDPFFARVLTQGECRERLEEVLGREVPFDPRVHLRAATPGEILVRMLSNLKHIHLRDRDFGRALACCERILLLAPDEPAELRDRGLVLEQLECFVAAEADLSRFLELAPDDASADAVRARVAELRRRAPPLH